MKGESQSEWEEEIETQLEKRCLMGVIDTFRKTCLAW